MLKLLIVAAILFSGGDVFQTINLFSGDFLLYSNIDLLPTKG
ncbi:hypothetical protein ACFL46_02140 [Candidatus Neomarinimicrobiota bacterium]